MIVVLKRPSTWVGFAAGALGPALFFWLLSRDVGPSTAAAIVAAAAFTACWLADLVGGAGGLPEPGSGRPGAALGAAACGLVGLQSLGLRGCAAGAGLAALAGWALSWWRRRRAWTASPPESSEPTRPLLAGPVLLAGLGLAAATWAGWTRLASLLSGHWLYAQSLTLSALLLGAGLGWRAGGKAAPGIRGGPAPAPLAFCVPAFFGLLGLAFLRFIGIDAGRGEYLHSPMADVSDLVFILVQSCAMTGLWAFLTTAACAVVAVPAAGIPSETAPRSPQEAWRQGAGSSERRRSPFAQTAALASALAGLAAGVSLERRAGPEAAVALPSLTLMLLALIASGPARVARMATLSKIAAVALILSFWLGWHSRHLLSEVWTNRLNAVYPGGAFTCLSESGDESLGVFRFPLGDNILLEDGFAVYFDTGSAKRVAHIPLLMASRPGQGASQLQVLLLGVRSPLTVASAMAYGTQVSAVDPHPSYKAVLAALSGAPWPPPAPGASPTVIQSGLMSYLERSTTDYDVILLEVPVPLETPKAAFTTTVESLSLAKSRLKPGGILALRVHPPIPPVWLTRILRTAEQVFPHLAFLDDLRGALILASADPLPEFDTLLGRMPVDAQLDDILLEDALFFMKYSWRNKPGAQAPAAEPPERADLPGNAFPLRQIISEGW
ncbi:MAG: hypothetical protein HY927_02980 [Elusimicrobia bacterium]|nr:hypothetical protein [Elusimicrobiota bacterium]